MGCPAGRTNKAHDCIRVGLGDISLVAAGIAMEQFTFATRGKLREEVNCSVLPRVDIIFCSFSWLI